MAKSRLPSPEVLRQLLRYEPDTGKLFWLARPIAMFAGIGRNSAAHQCTVWNTRYAGQEAFTATNAYGYRVGSILGTLVHAHIVIWAMASGEWPAHDVDHEDLNRSNNRLGNLRPATRSQNMMNGSLRKDSTSGHKGVNWSKQKGKWAVVVQANGKKHHGGHHDRIEDAVAARRALAEIVHGEFARD